MQRNTKERMAVTHQVRVSDDVFRVVLELAKVEDRSVGNMHNVLLRFALANYVVKEKG